VSPLHCTPKAEGNFRAEAAADFQELKRNIRLSEKVSARLEGGDRLVDQRQAGDLSSPEGTLPAGLGLDTEGFCYWMGGKTTLHHRRREPQRINKNEWDTDNTDKKDLAKEKTQGQEKTDEHRF
jgi:hypothetical protein